MPADASLAPARSARVPGAAPVAGVIAAATAIFATAVLAGVIGSVIPAAVIAVPVAVLVGLRLWSHPPVPLDWTGCPPALVAICGVAAVVMLVLVARLSVFEIDPARTGYSTMPSSDWEVRHNCLTAYFVAGDVVRRSPNVYDSSLYAAADDDPTKPRKPQMIGIFRVDQYEYPPTFLLAPRAVAVVAPGFLRLRATWFGLNGFVLLVALLAAARAMGPVAGTRALLLAPFVLGAYGTLNTLQKGNVQLVVIALSVLAMAAIERRHRAAGGALLAFCTVAKLYPGLLVVYLLVRREWRAALWTGAFSLVFVALTILDVGWQPFLAFREQFSGLLGGEAFPAFRNPGSTAVNLSIPGIVFKLKLFGASSMGFGALRVVGTLYMLVALAATVLLARRDPPEGQGPLIWLTILLLATLRSPFLPWSYGTFPAMWLLTLMAAAHVPRRWALAPFVLSYLALGLILPNDSGLDPRLTGLITTVPQLLMIALAIIVVRIQSANVDRHEARQIPEFAT